MPNNLLKPLTSREYKFMLRSERFDDLEKGVDQLWGTVVDLLNQITRGKDLSIKHQWKGTWDRSEWRKTHYCDVVGHLLKSNNFIFRVREEGEDDKTKEYKLTLKFRSPDRFLSASKDMKAKRKSYKKLKDTDKKSKFEEDIVPDTSRGGLSFKSKFSSSTSLEGKKKAPSIDTIEQLEKIYPVLKDLNLPKEMELHRVNDFTAHEVAIKLGTVDLEEDALIKSSVSLWYLDQDRVNEPLVAELSFDFDLLDDDDKPEIPIRTIETANQLFLTLLRQQQWFDPAKETKTGYAYNGFSGGENIGHDR